MDACVVPVLNRGAAVDPKTPLPPVFFDVEAVVLGVEGHIARFTEYVLESHSLSLLPIVSAAADLSTT